MKLSIYTIRPGGHAEEILNDRVTTRGGWCVARYVDFKDRATTHPETGFILRILSARGHYHYGYVGFDDTPNLFMGSREECEMVAREENINPSAITNLAVPLSAVSFRVLCYSHYDGSCTAVYEGKDFGMALIAHGVVLTSIQQAPTGGNYLRAVFEAEIDREDAEKARAITAGLLEEGAPMLPPPIRALMEGSDEKRE